MTKFILDGLSRRLPPNPTIEEAERILREVSGAKEIVSIGGGSTIDIGKYVAFKLNIIHTAIPTTAGTGSEVTKFAVFNKDGKRISLEDRNLIPHNYILDPERVVTLPPLHTASSGLDALAQGIESYWSPNANNESRHWSRLAIRFASKNLLDSYNHPNSQLLRMRMLQAANYSGRAINTTRTTICHAISYPLTLHYNIPHGIAVAMTLPFFMRYFGFKLIRPEHVEMLIRRMKIQLGENLDLDRVAKEALESKRAQNTPKKVTKDLILKALEPWKPEDLSSKSGSGQKRTGAPSAK